MTEVVTMSSSSDGSHTSSDSKPRGQSALYGLIGAVGLVEGGSFLSRNQVCHSSTTCAGADLVVLPALASSLQADLNLTQEDVALLVLVQAAAAVFSLGAHDSLAERHCA